MLIGSNEPLNINKEMLEGRWQRRNLDRVLAGTGFDSPEAIMSFYNLSDQQLREWAEFGLDPRIMTDDHPYVEYFLSLPEGSGAPNAGTVRNRTMQIGKAVVQPTVATTAKPATRRTRRCGA